jgi:hypothetical protein
MRLIQDEFWMAPRMRVEIGMGMVSCFRFLVSGFRSAKAAGVWDVERLPKVFADSGIIQIPPTPL